MSLRIVLAPLAEGDLVTIWRYTVDTWSEAKAEAYLLDLQEAFEVLAESPEIVRLRTEVTPAVRVYQHRSHLILYRNDEDVLDILRIVHNRSDWPSHLPE